MKMSGCVSRTDFKVTGTGNCFFLIAGAGKTGIRCLQALISLRQKRRKKGKKTLLGTVQAQPEYRHLRNSNDLAMKRADSVTATVTKNLQRRNDKKKPKIQKKHRRRKKN